MILTMYLSVTNGDWYGWMGDSGELWIRQVETGAVPHLDDGVVLWATEGADDGGPMWSVKRRYMDAGGSWHVELSRMILDPEEAARVVLGGWAAQGDNTARPWYTETDGDPMERLAAGDWLPHREWQRRR